MNIVIGTPLYPPEMFGPAPYSKELARRLAARGHEVSVVTYGRLPESVPGVKTIVVSKREALPTRIIRYLLSLKKTVKNDSILYIQNGPSVELPALIVSLIKRKKIIIGISDTNAHTLAQKNKILSIIESATRSRTQAILSDIPPHKPEIFPLEDYPKQQMDAYETAWKKHLAALENIFKKYGK